MSDIEIVLREAMGEVIQQDLPLEELQEITPILAGYRSPLPCGKFPVWKTFYIKDPPPVPGIPRPIFREPFVTPGATQSHFMEYPTGKPVVPVFNRLRQGFGGLSASGRAH